MSKYTDMGGPWIGAVRSWIQRTFVNGNTVIWNSNDELRGPPVTTRRIEEVAAIAVDAAIKDIDQYKERIEKYSRRNLELSLEVDSLKEQLERLKSKVQKDKVDNMISRLYYS